MKFHIASIFLLINMIWPFNAYSEVNVIITNENILIFSKNSCMKNLNDNIPFSYNLSIFLTSLSTTQNIYISLTMTPKSRRVGWMN